MTMFLTTMFEEKRRWRQYRAGRDRLPPQHRTAIEGLERYLLYYGSMAKGGVLVQMLEDLLDLFGQSAADGTSVRAVVGDDPVEFAEDFVRNYAEGQWISKERSRLVETIVRAESQEPG